MSVWAVRGESHGWVMPSAPWWKRLPVIRHVRAMWGVYCVAKHYTSGWGSIGIPTGYDDWVLTGIFHGMERP